jgi:hypothetical protein
MAIVISVVNISGKLARVTDIAAIDDIMAKNADKVAEYRGGKDKPLGSAR